MEHQAPNTSSDPAQPSRRIAADLRAAIQRGEYGPGHQLPSGSALMAHYGVARQTVQNAIDLLRAEGLVTSRAGAGVFVRDRPSVQRLARSRLSRAVRQAGRGAFLADARTGGFEPDVEVAIRVEQADDRTADALDIDQAAEVIVRDRVMRADGQAVMLATSRLPRTITAGTRIEQQDTGLAGIYGILEDRGHTLDHFVEYVTTRLVTEAEATVLKAALGTAVLAVTRVAYDRAGRALEINDMVMVGDRYELVYEIAAD